MALHEQDMGIDAASAAAHAARRGGSPLLEHFQNVVTEPASRTFEVSKCGCDCWYCADCCQRKGYTLRADLVPVLATFTGRMMLTLTVDPTLFASPREAYLYLRKQRAISRLMRELDQAGYLHSRRYFYVVEFQENTEQAHFHVLIDATFVPKPAIDAAWSRLRPKSAGPVEPNRPAFGMVRFSRRDFASPLHAARYATKYLVKIPEYGWPSWVMVMGKEVRVPRYGTSRGCWGREPEPANQTGKTREVAPRTYDERIRDCGSSCNVFELCEAVNPTTGEVTPQRGWLARLAIDSSIVEVLAPEPVTGKRRAILIAADPRGCIEAIQRAAGQPIRVISSIGALRPGECIGRAAVSPDNGEEPVEVQL